ncbi:MAG: Ig-like domain-containing protein, partial [Euryarchaeota archaeon]|nr:Ig-like domain-containing protein [Euryarchaeota archaeon]
PATVKDNLLTEYVEYYVDGRLAFTDYEAPFEFLLNTARYDNGTHEIRALAYDYAGNIGEMAATASFRNARLERDPGSAMAVGPAPTSASGLGWALAGPIALAILIAAGVAFAMGRTRRSGERALQNLVASASVQQELAALGPNLGLEPLFHHAPAPKQEGGGAPTEASDNPLIPAEWLR